MFMDETAASTAPPCDLDSGDALLLADLREALSSDGLELSYQPIVRSGDGDVVGVEALLRWNDPVRGRVSPGQIIPLAERHGLMPEIGRWVIRTATRQLAEWQRDGLLYDRNLHVNLTLQELLDPDMPEFIIRAVSVAGLTPQQFCFEVTEACLQGGGGPAERGFHALVDAGFQPVLDNFGSHSSVEILTRFPFAYAKIAHRLVAGESRPPHWARLLRGIGGLAKSLNIKLIVEGVESPEQIAQVAALGFAQAQGYAYGRPDTAGNVHRSLTSAWSWGDGTGG